jgi:hypothetical protein
MSQAGQFSFGAAGAAIETLTGDVGGAVTPVAGNVNILGGTNINTAGAVDTITINLDDDVALVGSIDVGTTLTVGTTVTFTSLTDGGLVADSSGVVAASAALTTFSGFASWTGAGAYFDDTVLGDFTVLRGGTGYINSTLVTWSGGQTVSGLTAGNTYLIYIDSTGTIGKTTTFTQATFDNNIALFECLRDSTAPANLQCTVKENHPYDFMQAVSFYLHEVVGTVIENNNQGANITLNGTQKIQINGADELADHGLYTTIPDSSGTAEIFKQMYTNASGKWALYTSSDTFDGTWNNAGTATAPTGNKFSVYTLYASKDNLNSSTPVYAEYNNLAGAQLVVAAGTMAIATAELAKLELCQLGHIIYQQSISTIVDVIVEKATLRAVTAGGGASNDAALILTNTTLFDGILSAADTNVQVALETIDEWGKTTTDHAVLIGNGTGSAIGSLAVGTNGQVLVGSTGADPVFATLASSDNSIDYTTGAGTLDLSVTGTVAINAQTGTSYTLVLADAGKLVTLDNAAAITLTVPPNSSVAFDTGTTILFSQKGAGTATFSPGSGVTLSSAGSLLSTSEQYSMVSIIKIATNTWLVSGDLA